MTYLQLPEGHRSSIYPSASRRQAPVYAWRFRLWPWTGRDLLDGLLRVKAAAREETLAMADTIVCCMGFGMWRNICGR